MTPKQQRFVDAYIVEPNATKAVVKAGYKATNARTTGSKLLTNVDIAAEIASQRDKAAVKALLTLETHIATLAELRDEARALEQIGAAITAETNRGKAAGLYVERTENRSQHDHIIRVIKINGLRDGDE